VISRRERHRDAVRLVALVGLLLGATRLIWPHASSWLRGGAVTLVCGCVCLALGASAAKGRGMTFPRSAAYGLAVAMAVAGSIFLPLLFLVPFLAFWGLAVGAVALLYLAAHLVRTRRGVGGPLVSCVWALWALPLATRGPHHVAVDPLLLPVVVVGTASAVVLAIDLLAAAVRPGPS
jgi:hypothetical protein